MRHATLAGLVLFLLLLPTPAAADKIELRYDPTGASPPSSGTVVRVDARIERSEGHGGEQPDRFGTAHGDFYRPYPLMNNGPQLGELLRPWLRDVATQAGYAAAAEGSFPILTVVVDEFWFNTYDNVKVTGAVRLEVRRDGVETPIWVSDQVAREVEVGPRGRGRKREARHQEAFEALLMELAAGLRGEVLKTQAFKDALEVDGPATCKTDLDCSSDWICGPRGVCIDSK